MAEIVGNLHPVIADFQDFAGLVFDPQKILGLARVVPGAFENFSGELEYYVGTKVRPLTRRIDSLWVRGLQDIVGGPALLIAVKPFRSECPFMQNYIAPGHARAGRGVAEVIRRQAGIGGSVFELYGRTQALVHRVHETAP